MPRTLLRSLALVVVLGSGAPVFAADTQVAAARAELQKERQATISAGLGLTEEEGRGFWPVYRDYRMEMARVGDRLVTLLTEYTDKYSTLADADATRMLDEYLAIQSSELSLRKKYLKGFRKVLPPKKVGRFYQLENRLDAAIRYELGGLIPLAR